MNNFKPLFNVFISWSNVDEIQSQIYDDIYNKYIDNIDITIIDVNNVYDGVNNNLCEGILNKIKECDLFICLLTPIQDNINMTLNPNVVLELGYAYSCVNKDNIHIYIENDENKKQNYENICPSMLSSLKYNTYISYEDIDDLINISYEKYECNNNIHTLTDTTILSYIKYDLHKIIYSNIKINKKIRKMQQFIYNYEYKSNIIDMSVDMIILFLDDYINKTPILNFFVINWFFKIFVNTILDNGRYVWFNQKNNQLKIMNIFKILKYKLFLNNNYKNNKEINNCRMNFALSLFEICDNCSYKSKFINLINESACDYSNSDYKKYIIKLNMYQLNKLTDNCDCYEDIIEESNSCYNKYNIYASL
mgnify:FL=1